MPMTLQGAGQARSYNVAQGSLGNRVSAPTASTSGTVAQSGGSSNAPAPSTSSYVIKNTTTGTGSQTVDKWGYAIPPVGMTGPTGTFLDNTAFSIGDTGVSYLVIAVAVVVLIIIVALVAK